jgi:predicted MFS family arabinose efflux permease
MTEAFTWGTAAMFVGIAIGSAAAGSLVGTAGVGAPFAAACAAAALAAALAALPRRHRQPRAALEHADYRAT